jgi:hypothetical protein
VLFCDGLLFFVVLGAAGCEASAGGTVWLGMLISLVSSITNPARR